MTNLIAGLALALTFGGMTFFSAVMAPLVFTKLPAELRPRPHPRRDPRQPRRPQGLVGLGATVM